MNSVKIYDPEVKPLLTLTPAAIAHITKEINKHQAMGLRVGVKKAGCSGLKYVVDYVYKPEPQDRMLMFADDLCVYIQTSSLSALQGIEIDYVREGLNGSLKFNNPNEKGSCGCGESFSV